MTTGFDMDLNPLINDTKAAIEQQMNGEISKGVWMTSKVHSMSVHHLQLSADHLSVDLELVGLLKLKIK
jgi:hypothetical protein